MKYSEERVASIQGNFLPTIALIHTLRLQKRGFLYETGYLPGFKFSSCVLFDCKQKVASISSDEVEIEANAVIYSYLEL